MTVAEEKSEDMVAEKVVQPYFSMRRFFLIPTFSPMGFLLWAGLLAAVFLVLHVLGFREYACILSGTGPSGDLAHAPAIAAGVLYVLAYFAFALAVPILVMAAGILSLLHKLIR